MVKLLLDTKSRYKPYLCRKEEESQSVTIGRQSLVEKDTKDIEKKTD